MKSKTVKHFPEYAGQKWISSELPNASQNWLDGKKYSIRKRSKGSASTRESVKNFSSDTAWSWPKREIIFISDLHADADAFFNSLVASGGVRKTGPKDHQFKLTEKGKNSLFIFGGDFFDKGPSNLRLLDCLHLLIKKRARVRLLAGNHDIRVLFGMRSVGNTDDPRNGHFFIRMGAKAVPFLKEICEKYPAAVKRRVKTITEKESAKNLYPQKIWWQQFPDLANWVMPKATIERELGKIEKKTARFEQVLESYQLTLKQAYAAALIWQDLFLEAQGKYHWFFKRLRLASRKGSFLFVHAGLDDRTCTMLNEYGTSYLNRTFRTLLTGSPFEFYYGPIANTIRTKYRIVDMPLTLAGAKQVHQAGIHAIVHGHRNLHHGQRIALRKNILHFECDLTLDQCSRKKEGLSGVGGGATLIRPDGYILGVSSDYPKVKVFNPDSL